MTPADAKKLVLHALLITAGLLAAVWYWLRPLQAEYGQLRGHLMQESAELASLRQALSRARLPADDATRRLRARAAMLTDLWSTGEDPTAVFDTIQERARAERVELLRVEPAPGSTPDVPTPPWINVEANGFSIDFRASCADAIAFIDALHQHAGLAMVAGFRIAPEDDPSGTLDNPVRGQLNLAFTGIRGTFDIGTTTTGASE